MTLRNIQLSIDINLDDDEIGLISDGHHSFNELYEHRSVLFISLLNSLRKVPTWKSKRHYDEENFPMYKDWFIAGINTKKGEQITYHLNTKYWDSVLCKEIYSAPKFDGHTSEDVILRLNKLWKKTNRI